MASNTDLRHLQEYRDQIARRLKLIETRLGILYHPKIKLPPPDEETLK